MNLQSAILKLELVDEATGEVTTKEINALEVLAAAVAAKPKRSSSSKAKLVEDSTPRLILEDSKYVLTSGALEMLGVEPGSEDRLDIRYQKVDNLEYPLIGKPEAYGDVKGGNRITKSGTVRFSGSKHDHLMEFGTEFILAKHPNTENLFILTQDGNAFEGSPVLESVKSDKKAYKSVTKTAPDKVVEQPEPEAEDMNNIDSLLDNDKDFDSSDFTL